MRAATRDANAVSAPETIRCGLTVIAALLVACGDDTTRAVAPSAAECASNWQPMLTQPTGFEPRSLVLAGDALLFRTLDGSVADANEERALITSLSLDDWGLRTLVEDESELLWLEGDHLLYTHLASQDSLFSVPLGGGVPALVLEGGSARAGIYGFPTGLDAEHYYWVNPLDASDRTFSIWRRPRAGGDAERFASLPDFNQKPRVWLGAAGLIAADGGKSSLLPLDGSAAVPLADVSSLSLSPLGFDELGVYWNSGPSQAELDIIRAPVTGDEPEAFWPSKPDGFVPSSVWSDGQGGWFVSGQETFDDGVPHYELWSLDAGENGRLLACDPGTSKAVDLTPPVTASGAAFQIVWHQTEPLTWSIVKMSLD